ncbi:hypothetical protein EMGBS4_15320 [Acidimicrobiaceae bacterium]|nr:hypothetical protein EMGBS4_15320 [Acidimicrobiaceae bacterium]
MQALPLGRVYLKTRCNSRPSITIIYAGSFEHDDQRGLPLYLVSRIEKNYDLTKMTVGILGMAFKAESDDIRSSLSYKLKRILRFKAEAVYVLIRLCTTMLR